jgi:transposase, IS6 family
VVPYLNNIVEQDHRSIKRRINASLGFRSFAGAERTIQGYEAMHMIRKGQVRWLAKGDIAGQVRIPAKVNADSEGKANGIPGRRRTDFGA